MMQIKDPSFFGRGRLTLPLRQDITPDSLLAELQQTWGPSGFEVYKTALFGADVVLKKTGFTGIALKINHSPMSTEILYNPLAPSAFARIFFMGLIPLLIVYNNSWKPLLAEFKRYLQTSPFFGGQMGMAYRDAGRGRHPMAAAGHAGQLPPGQMPMQQPGQMPMQQPGQMPMQQPGQMPMQQPGQMPMQQPGQAPPAGGPAPGGGHNPQGGGWQG